MSLTDPARTAGMITRGALAVSAVMCGWLLVLHARMVVSAAPQEMREGGTIWLTRLLLEHRNPYALAELPASTSTYGILYYLIVLPLARLFGNHYAVGRFVSALAILGSCVLLYRLLRRAGTDRELATAGTIVFYVSSLYFVAPLARPDSLGVFLSLASASILFRDEVGTRRFAIGLAFALLALLTKVYLAYPPFVLAGYFVCVGPRARGAAYGLTSAMAAGALLLAITALYPAYINVAILVNAQSASYYASHVMSQTVDWLTFGLPLTVALAVALLRPWNTPGPFGFAVAVNALVFALVLGGHRGAHMTYLFQLVTPPLLVATLPRAGRRAWARAAIAVAVPASFILNARYFPLTLERFTRSEATFLELERTIRSHRRVLGSTEVAGEIARAGQAVYDSGQSQYFPEAVSTLPIPGLVSDAAIERRWAAFQHDLDEGIAGRQFDVIVRNRRHGLLPDASIAQHYVVDRTLDVEFAWSGQRWPLDVWIPRRRP